MFNPLVDSFEELSDSDLENRIYELQKKYYIATNPDIKLQLHTVLEMHRHEAEARRAKSLKKQQDDDNSLDNLINIS
jgi:hypothetical protein